MTNKDTKTNRIKPRIELTNYQYHYLNTRAKILETKRTQVLQTIFEYITFHEENFQEFLFDRHPIVKKNTGALNPKFVSHAYAELMHRVSKAEVESAVTTTAAERRKYNEEWNEYETQRDALTTTAEKQNQEADTK